MKKTIFGTIATILAATIWFGGARLLVTPAVAQEPTVLVFSVSFTGTPTGHDTGAAQFIVDIENTRLAGLTPPGTPLPDSTPGELKASALGLLSTEIQQKWDTYVKKAGAKAGDIADIKQIWLDATDEQRVAMVIAGGG